MRPLLISHDLSRSGAPLALLELAAALKRQGERPLVAPLYGGPLEQQFRDAGVELARSIDPRAIGFVIANTALSVPSALRFRQFGIPVAAWLHESAHFFRIIGVAPRDCGLHDVDYVLLPAKFQAHDLAPHIPGAATYQLRNLVRQPSFRPTAGDGTLAVCGQWEPRKGQARLLELARGAQASCRFKFIGAERAAASSTVDAGTPHQFPGSLAPEAARAQIASSDGFISCSVAEVQPLSALEGLMAGRPALLSAIDAHRAIADQVPNVVLYDRDSTASFAQGLGRLLAAIDDVEAGQRARAAAEALFGEAAFDRRVAEIVRLLRAGRGAPPDIARFQDD
jgi:glycosyltransferase involved in cell wall biosynthesis